jgi:hypothetical protein
MRNLTTPTYPAYFKKLSLLIQMLWAVLAFPSFHSIRLTSPALEVGAALMEMNHVRGAGSSGSHVM